MENDSKKPQSYTSLLSVNDKYARKCLDLAKDIRM